MRVENLPRLACSFGASIIKLTKMLALLWKSGPSGPR